MQSSRSEFHNRNWKGEYNRGEGNPHERKNIQSKVHSHTKQQQQRQKRKKKKKKKKKSKKQNTKK